MLQITMGGAGDSRRDERQRRSPPGPPLAGDNNHVTSTIRTSPVANNFCQSKKRQ